MKRLIQVSIVWLIGLSVAYSQSEPSGAPILRIETGMHTDTIGQISVDAQERFLLTASDDKTLRLWDLKTGDLITTYRVPIGAPLEGILNAGAISPDGELVVGGGWTGVEWEQSASIYLFNRANGNLVKRLYGLPGAIQNLCFSPAGRYLAASLAQFGIRIWETQRWAQVFSHTPYGDGNCQFDAQNRLLTTSSDGYLRLYAPSRNSFFLLTQTQLTGGKAPHRAVFSLDGNKIAVGFYDSTQINILDGQTLAWTESPDTSGVNDNLAEVAWSADGQRLCAGGIHQDKNGNSLIRCWLQTRQGSYTDWIATTNRIFDLLFLKNGNLVYGTADPRWGIFDSAGNKQIEHIATIADYRNSQLLVSYDGGTIRFSLEPSQNYTVQFSIFNSLLLTDLPSDTKLLAPDIYSLNITDWKSTYHPKLNDVDLPLGEGELSRSLAIAPNRLTFLLGTDWNLRLFDVSGQLKWEIPVNLAWTINISGDGQKAIAALADGTIRWYNLSNGEELFTLFPHTDGKRWIAWTPLGYYMSSDESADSLLGWHVNHGRDQEASFYPVGQKYSKIYKRPEVVQRTLVVLDEKKALEELQAENTPKEPSKTPILRIETGTHTARINQIDIDANERFLVTASYDKTLRLWDLKTGKLVETYRIPIESLNSEGLLLSTAISPDGQWIAAGGWTGVTWDQNVSIYLIDRNSGQLAKRLTDLPQLIYYLCFSPDGQYLAASLGGENGIRVWETQQWEQIFADTEYTGSSHSCQFDSQNRLLTSAYDGYLRLYSPDAGSFTLEIQTQPPGGKLPSSALFSSTGRKIAVGFADSAQINVLDGQTLDVLYVPDTSDISDNAIFKFYMDRVAWSSNDQQLCTGGNYGDGYDNVLIRCWSQGGQGNYTDQLALTSNFRFLKNGDLVNTGGSNWGILDKTGRERLEQITPVADYRNPRENGFLVSKEGDIVQFGLDYGSSRPVRFFLNQQNLLSYPAQDSSLYTADTISLNITDWKNNIQPKLNGKTLPVESNEIFRSLAISPDKSKFLLSATNKLILFDDNGQLLWNISTSGTPWAVNISGDGQKAIAALGDGTIRWYNLSNGEELLAFFPHVDGKRWIAWTPSGYYMSSGENADKLLGWHKNHGKDQAAEFLSISEFQAESNRPDIVKKVLVTLTEDKAILVANLEKNIDATPPKTQSQRWEEANEKSKVKPTPSGLGKAIIVAASGPQANQNTLFPYTNQFTERMYNLLYQRGFSDGDVIYINPYPPAVPPNNYAYEQPERQDFPLRDPLSELKQAFDQAARDLKSGQQFIFYLHGHAGYQTIRLRLGQESEPSVDLSAQQLKELLAQIPKDIPQIIILDTCHSGSFLTELAGVPNRVVVTSADSDSLAWTSGDGKSFANKFLSVLGSNSSVYEAFKEARKIVLDDPKTFGNQSPQLDDNQDGQYVEDKDKQLVEGEDGRLASQIKIGGDKIFASDSPQITEVHPAIYLDPQETTATLWVKTSVDMNTVNKVRAILTNENDKPTEYQGEQTQFTRREITLTPNYELQRFEIEYNGFQSAKQWRIFYQVETTDGQWSDFAEGYVRTDQDASSIMLEAIMNQTVYQQGDPFRFEVITAGEGNFDLYVGLIFPDNNYYTIRYPFQFSGKNELLPYQQNLQFAGAQTFTILSLGTGLLPMMLPGEHQACGLFTKAQSDPNDTANWVKLHCQPFQFQ